MIVAYHGSPYQEEGTATRPIDMALNETDRLRRDRDVIDRVPPMARCAATAGRLTLRDPTRHRSSTRRRGEDMALVTERAGQQAGRA